MKEMLEKLMKLVMTFPVAWLETIVDLCEKLMTPEGPEIIENLKLLLCKNKIVYTRSVTSLSLSGEFLVEVYEKLRVKANYRQMFDELAHGRSYDDLCMPKNQREEYVKQHISKPKVKGWVLFLYKEGGEFFVERMSYHLGRDFSLSSYVQTLSYDYEWGASRRILLVVPQRIIEPPIS